MCVCLCVCVCVCLCARAFPSLPAASADERAFVLRRGAPSKFVNFGALVRRFRARVVVRRLGGRARPRLRRARGSIGYGAVVRGADGVGEIGRVGLFVRVRRRVRRRVRCEREQAERVVARLGATYALSSHHEG